MKQYPYWLDTLGDDDAVTRRDEEPGKLPTRVDVAIVGAGYTGLAAARHLGRRGASVIVLESERIGAGASARAPPPPPPRETAARWSRASRSTPAR